MASRQHLIASCLLVTLIVMVFLYIQQGEKAASSRADVTKRIRIDGLEDGLERYATRTLQELIAEENNKSAVFSKVALAALNRQRLSNYYLHGLRTGEVKDYRTGNLCFMHVQKTGGTTVKSKLRMINRELGIPYTRLEKKHNVEYYERYRRAGGTFQRTMFFGDLSFGICDLLHGRPCSYFTMLRNPYDRIISAYFYCFNQALCGPVTARESPIIPWAIHQGSHVFNQLLMLPDTCQKNPEADRYTKLYMNQTKGIIKYNKNEIPCWFQQKALLKEVLTSEQRHALLNHLLDNLEHLFSVILLTEDFALSLELAQEVYHLPIATLVGDIKNEGKHKPDKSEIERLRQELLESKEAKEALYEDLMIYQKGREIMQRQKEEFLRLKQSRNEID